VNYYEYDFSITRKMLFQKVFFGSNLLA